MEQRDELLHPDNCNDICTICTDNALLQYHTEQARHRLGITA